jgi:hypothetical protein
MRWAVRCLYGLAVFQVVIAVLLWINFEPTVTAFAGHSFAPTRSAAEGAALGALIVHLVLAVLSVVFARTVPAGKRGTRIRATVMLAITAVGGVAAMGLPSQTYLSPIGVALALAALCLLWAPSNRRVQV